MTRSYKYWLLACFVSMVFVYGFHYSVSKRTEFVIYSDGFFQISDYAYHIILVNKFWFHGFGNIYDLSFQQETISTYVGSKIYTVMPLGITPVALVVWFPFAYAAQFNLSLSYTLWIFFSLSVLILALWRVGRYVAGT